MKHINESIIGRRSSDRIFHINDIKTGDIIKFRSGLLAMAYISRNESNSGLYFNTAYNTVDMITIKSLNNNMKFFYPNTTYLDIIAVYRDPNNIIGSDKNFKGFKVGQHYSTLEKSNLQRLIDNRDYEIIYEEK